MRKSATIRTAGVSWNMSRLLICARWRTRTGPGERRRALRRAASPGFAEGKAKKDGPRGRDQRTLFISELVERDRTRRPRGPCTSDMTPNFEKLRRDFEGSALGCINRKIATRKMY